MVRDEIGKMEGRVDILNCHNIMLTSNTIPNLGDVAIEEVGKMKLLKQGHFVV